MFYWNQKQFIIENEKTRLTGSRVMIEIINNKKYAHLKSLNFYLRKVF